jgi:lysozyme
VKISPRGLLLITDHEQFRPTAYLPTKNDRWTIAWGHTKGVKEGDTCTHEQGKVWLADDVGEAEAGVLKHVHVPLTQNQFDALVSLVFNIGAGIRDGKKGDFADSTLVDKLNALDYTGAAAQFDKWVYQGKKKLGGLVIRRATERILFKT